MRLYQAVFGRAPDAGGFTFWTGQAASGRSMYSIATEFASSPEFRARYGAAPSDRELIDGLYRNGLGRTADASGLGFWLGQRAAGMSVLSLLIAFADSEENRDRTGTRP